MPCLSDLHKNKRALVRKARKNMDNFPIFKEFRKKLCFRVSTESIVAVISLLGHKDDEPDTSDKRNE